jgi:hypothetical protein
LSCKKSQLIEEQKFKSEKSRPKSSEPCVCDDSSEEGRQVAEGDKQVVHHGGGVLRVQKVLYQVQRQDGCTKF